MIERFAVLFLKKVYWWILKWLLLWFSAISSHNWSLMVDDTQFHRSKVSLIYKIVKKLYPPGYHYSGFMAIHTFRPIMNGSSTVAGTVHHVPKFKSCHKAVVMTMGRVHCFHHLQANDNWWKKIYTLRVCYSEFHAFHTRNVCTFV